MNIVFSVSVRILLVTLITFLGSLEAFARCRHVRQVKVEKLRLRSQPNFKAVSKSGKFLRSGEQICILRKRRGFYKIYILDVFQKRKSRTYYISSKSKFTRRILNRIN